MKKHFLLKSLLTCLCLQCALLANAAFTVGGLDYEVISGTQTVKIVTRLSNGTNSYTGAITVPATVEYNSTTYTVVELGSEAFDKSTITSITLPEGLTTISMNAFYGCQSLTTITLPASVTSVSSSAFADCRNLTAISVATGNTSYSSVDGVLFNASNYLISYPLGKGASYTIPATTTGIGDYTFNTSASSPTLTKLSVTTTTPIAASNFSFSGLATHCTLKVPTSSCVSTYRAAAGWSSFVNIVGAVDDIQHTYHLSATSIDMMTTDQLQLQLLNENNVAVTEGITWSSADENVAVVGSDGSLSSNATAYGQTTITATYGGVDYTCSVVVHYLSGTGSWSVSDVCSQNGLSYGLYNGHYYVDLGTAGKWATTNVGAAKAEDYGNYYGWGEIEPYPADNYSSSPTTLPLSNDVAYQTWGGSWRMPTKAEFLKLLNNCNITSTTINGKTGYKFTSKSNTNNWIFLPLTGAYRGSSKNGSGSWAWYYSSSNGVILWMHMFSSPYYEVTGGLTTDGCPVRPILGSAPNTSNNHVVTLYASGCSTPNTLSCPDGTELTIELKAKNNYRRFMVWSDGSMDNPRTMVVISDVTLTASYIDICGDDAYWEITNGCLTITGNGDMYDFTSSTTTPWADRKSEITSVVISDGITKIGNYAFSGCTNLSSITLPTSITSIGNSAFSGTMVVNVTSVQPPTLTGNPSSGTDVYFVVPASSYLTYKAADYWSDLVTSAQLIPYGYESYTAEVTADANLSSLHMTIGEEYLAAIRKLKIVGTINSYDLMVMRNKMLKLVNLDLEEATIVANSYEYYSGYCSHNNKLERYSIPSGVQTLILPRTLVELSNFACFGNTALKSVKIHCENLTKIGKYAFDGCTGLTSVEFIGTGTSDLEIGESAFRSCCMTSISLPSNLISVGQSAFESSSLKDVTIPAHVNSMGGYVFNNSRQLETIVFEDGCEITTLPGYGGCSIFRDCASLSSVDLSGTGLTTLPQLLFLGCGNLKEVKLPSSLESIPSYAFRGCSIGTLTIPASVTTIGQYAFGKEDSSDPAACVIDTLLFEANSNLQTIEAYSFANCSTLKHINLQPQMPLSAIGDYSFYKCINLGSVVIPESTSTIGAHAFYNCKALKNVVLSPGVQIISEYAFCSCSKLESVSMPSTVKSIGDYAFSYCTQLASFKVPSGVETIGTNAFSGCTALADLYSYTVEPTVINQNTFTNWTTANLHIPTQARYIYFYNTQWSQFTNLTHFLEPYDYFYANGKVTIQQSTGVYDGNPEVMLYPGGSVVVRDNLSQSFSDVHLCFDATAAKASGQLVNKAASIVGGANTSIVAGKHLTHEITVAANKWYFFSFPFDVDLTTGVQKEGNWIFREYRGTERAVGHTGFANVTDGTLHRGKGYIFQTNTAGKFILTETTHNFTPAAVVTPLEKNASTTGNETDANWNFIGNPSTGYYNLNDLNYQYPITVWNGTTYESVRFGDDAFELHPYQGFFVQANDAEANPTVNYPATPHTYTEAQQNLELAAASVPARRSPARSSKANPRKLINLEITDGENVDKTRVVFNNLQSLNYEQTCDAAKFLSNDTVPQLYSMDSQNTRYSINERPYGDTIVPLGIVVKEAGVYTISAARLDIPMYLVDVQSGEKVNLSEGDFEIALSAGTYEGRFYLGAPMSPTGLDNIGVDDMDSFLAVDGGILINAAAGEDIMVYTANGMLVAENPSNGVLPLQSGAYVVSANGKSAKVVVK